MRAFYLPLFFSFYDVDKIPSYRFMYVINVPHDGHKWIEIHQNGAIPADYDFCQCCMAKSIALLFYSVIFGGWSNSILENTTYVECMSNGHITD